MKNFIASYSFTSDLGIKVLKVEYGIDDRIVWCWNRFGKDESERKSKQLMTKSGRTYFRAGNIPVYLDECLRSEIF